MPRVLVPLAQDCEELEAVTIIDLLRRAGVEVVTAGLDAQPVTASRGVRLLPDTSLDELVGESFDLIALPGGLPGADHLAADARLLSMLRRQSEKNGRVAAICAAPRVLAAAGLLENREVTAYPGTLDKLSLPDTDIRSCAVHVDNNITTSRGPGTAMDFALSLVEQLCGKDRRDEVEAGLAR